MKRFCAFILCAAALICFIPQTEANALSFDPSYVRVKLSTNNAAAIAISVRGDYFIKENGAYISGGTLTLRSNMDGTITAIHSSLGEVFTGAAISIMRVNMAAEAGYLTFNSRRYLGHVYAKAMPSGYIQIINEVPLAHYLYGVVAYEMNNTYPIEALKAQSVAAKSYVLSIIAANPNARYHIGDTSSDQVYKGYNPSYTNVIAAVDSTISDVLTVNGNILCAYYSASNGGETIVPSHAWPSKKVSDSGFAIALDSSDAANPLSLKETLTIPINSPGKIPQAFYDMLLAKLSQAKGMQAEGLSLIRSVELTEPKGKNEQRNMTKVNMTVDGIFSGMVYENIQLSFSAGEFMLYRVFTNSNLRAYWGEYTGDFTAYRIYHVRWGHGVGLSQRGAQQRAAEGWGYRDILAFYYPGASISQLDIALPQAPVRPAETAPSETKPAETLPQETPSGAAKPVEKPIEEAIGTGISTARVNIRTGPGTQYQSLGILAKNASLTVYDYESGWYKVKVDGTTVEGYIIGSYMSFSANKPEQAEPQPSHTPAPDATPQQGAESAEGAIVLNMGIITGSGVNLRAGAGSEYRSIKKLSKNTQVIILASDGKWNRVIAGADEGYVHSDYVKSTGTALIAAGETPSLAEYGTGKTTGSVNLRAGIGTSTKKLAVLKKGAQLRLYELKDGWYRVKTEGDKEGYVSAKYVSVSTAIPDMPQTKPESSADSAGGNKQACSGETTGTVNLRAKPSTASKVVTKLNRGTAVILYSLENGWYEAECGGKRGYLYAKYVRRLADAQIAPETPSEGENGKAEPQVKADRVELATAKTSAKVNMRTGASTTGTGVLATLPAGTGLNVLAEMGEWYYVLYDGRTGFCYKAYVSVLSQGSAGIPKLNTPLMLSPAETRSNVNFRTGPATTYAIIRELKKGEAVIVYLIDNNWCLVKYGDEYGYLRKDYVKLK